MSEIKKYKKYLNFKANPRYLTRDFIVPLYTGTEPDILDDSNTQRESNVYKEFPNEMPIVSPKEIQNQPYEQLQLADGGRANFSEGSKLTGTDKTLEQNIKSDHKAFNDYRKSIGSPTIPLDNEYIRMWIRTRLNEGGSVERQGFSAGSDFKDFLNTLDKKTLRKSSLSNLIEQSNIKISKTNAANVLANPEFKKIRPGREIGLSSNRNLINLLEGKTGMSEYVEFKDKKYYKASDGRIKELQPYTKERIEKRREQTKLFTEKKLTEQGVFPLGGTDVKKNLWYHLYRSSDATRPEEVYTRLKIDPKTKTNFWNTENARKVIFYDTENNNKKITFDNLEKYINNTFGKDHYNKLIEPYKTKNFINQQTVNVKGKPVSLRGELRKRLLTPREQLNPKAAVYEVHHPYGMTKNPFVTQLSFRDANGTEFRLKDKMLRDFKNSKTLSEKRNIFKGFLNKIDELPGSIQTAPGKKIYGENLSSEQFVKELGERSKLGRQFRSILNNPEIQNKAIQMIGDLACGARAKAMNGGRINFSEGSDCFNKGLKILEEGNLNKQQLTLAEKAIASADEAAPVLKNILSRAGTGIKFTGLGVKELISFGAGPIGLGIGAAIEASEAIPELAKGDWRQAIRSTTLGFLPESVVGSRRTDILRMAKTDEEKNAANLLFDYQDKVDEANRIQGQIEALKNPEFTSVEGYDSDPGMKIKELEGVLKNLDSYLAKNEKAVNKVFPTVDKLSKQLVESNVSNIIDPTTGKPTFLGNIFGTTSAKNKQGILEDVQKDVYQEPEQDEKEIPFQESNIVGPDDSIVNQYNEGGRIGLSGGGGPKIGRRGFLGLIAGAAAAPDLIKAIKGTGQAGKIASKIKLEKAEGMYPWFPDLVEKIKTKGKPFEEKEIIMEASYKHEPKGYGGLPKGEETVTRHVDGDTEFLLREYPDGRIAVDIHSPRNQEGSSTPVTLYYRPTMELKYYDGVKVEPAEFKVLEKEPRYFANGPDDVDIEMSEMRKVPGKNTIFGDVEAAERFATGKIKNRKIIPAKQARREQMEDAPTDFIEETSPYGPDTF
jgi:hypothetical protein